LIIWLCKFMLVLGGMILLGGIKDLVSECIYSGFLK
jgi:hypothetical protein